jgi:O-antigen/teichoic acid export membrane protein
MINALIPVLILPIITRILSPEDYGVVVIYTAISGIALPLLTLSVDSSILLNFFKVEKKDFSSYFSSGYLLIIISSCIFIPIILLFRKSIAELTSFPYEWVSVLLLTCFLQIHSNLTLHLFQVKRKPLKYGVFSIAQTAITNALLLYLLILRGMNYEGIMVAYFMSALLFFVISMYIYQSNGLFTKRIRKDFVIDNMKVGYPLSLHVIGSWLANSATRIIIGGILGTAAAGSFGVGATIGLVVSLIQDSFNKAYVPYLFDQLNNFTEKTEAKLIKLTYIYNLGLLVFAIAIGLAGYFTVGFIFGAEYENAKSIVLLIAVAYAFNGMYKMHVNYIFFTKNTQYIFYITLSTGLLNILLSYLLVSSLGIVGGAVSLCIINFLGYLLSWYIGNKVFPMRWFDTNSISLNSF